MKTRDEVLATFGLAKVAEKLTVAIQWAMRYGDIAKLVRLLMDLKWAIPELGRQEPSPAAAAAFDHLRAVKRELNDELDQINDAQARALLADGWRMMAEAERHLQAREQTDAICVIGQLDSFMFELSYPKPYMRAAITAVAPDADQLVQKFEERAQLLREQYRKLSDQIRDEYDRQEEERMRVMRAAHQLLREPAPVVRQAHVPAFQSEADFKAAMLERRKEQEKRFARL